MMKFKSYEEIVEEMLKEFAKELGVDYVSNSSDIAIKSKVYAAQIEGLYYNQEFIMKQSNPLTATDNYLDIWGKSMNVEGRKLATSAVGTVVFYRETPFSSEDIKIPKGTIVSTNQNIIGTLVEATTTDDVFLKQGELEVAANVKTIQLGEDTNLSKGSISIINNPPPGIEFVKQLEPFRDGSNREDDEIFRDRFKKNKFYGTDDAFAAKAMEVSGVTSAKTLELNRGPGTADILISSANGVPSDELLSRVKEHILKRRPICSDLDVIKANIYKLDYDIKVKLKDDVKLDSKIDNITVLERIRTSIVIYLKTVGINGVIRKSGLIRVITSLDEVVDVDIISPKNNIVLENNSIAEEGDFNVKEI